MINFAALELKVNTKYSFVGIQKEGSKLIFHIPKGFSEDDINTFDKKRDLFFRLYRVLNVFKQICIEKGYLNKNNQANDRDGVLEVDTGSEITSDDDSKNIFYSKLDVLASILDAYDELKILGLVSRLGKSERLDYSKLHRYLNNAVFLNNGAIYIDAMNLSRKEIHFDSTDIVAMYCYILTEIKEQLQQEVNPDIKSLAERFQEKYLGIEASLFNEKYYLRVTNELKDALELIDHYTPIKDSDYWDFYEAIYKFLFGDLDNSLKGEVWGFSNFNTIWESMCLTHVIHSIALNSIFYFDKTFISNSLINKWNDCSKIIDITHIFNINGNNLIPDLVIWSFESEEGEILSLTNREFKKRNYIEYSLTKNDSFNDHGYLTIFDINIKFGGKRISQSRIKGLKITNIDKSLEENLKHCFNDIKINSKQKLPDNYYSYWNVTNINHEELVMMISLNHIFYKALLMKLYDYTNFFEEFICNIFGTDAKINNNIFYWSLFREYSRLREMDEINQLYKEFLDKRNFYFIDIKYSDPQYYENIDKIEEIKNRSIRKQFVYEYILQKHLEKTNNPLKELDIKSEFWLPAYSETQETFIPMPENTKFMNNYIKLTGVNIMAVIDSYLETEEK
ncbi:hypothetical protein H6G06_18225 [Anabaena sphaerica FACHB-251]|uniref:DUF2357 domain-containing protein n=1 Tax=Anabaena sphaerica FACHB-251 TaxID=2692883 RepID=A0A927A242_9NOST|nr:hypothetical protein [Anabaena sphaerica]MBD2295354.1 hypothetical protein [Anabaena sphaerica FACHB-251]